MRTQKSYLLRKVKDQYMVISLDYKRIEESFNDIANELNKKDFTGVLVFDLLLSNGLNNRFYSASFLNKKLDLTTFKAIANVDSFIKDFSGGFFIKNKEILYRGVLTARQVEQISNGKTSKLLS